MIDDDDEDYTMSETEWLLLGILVLTAVFWAIVILVAIGAGILRLWDALF